MRRDSTGNTALHYSFGQHDLRDLLIKAGANITATNNEQQTPAFYQFQMSNEDADANVMSRDGQTLLDYDTHITQEELNANQQMHLPVQDSLGRTLLHWAVLTGNPSAILSMAGDFNERDHCGCTPLHSLMAASSDFFDESVFNLLVSKCDVNAVNIDSQTALHMAACQEFDNASCIKGLIKAGARYGLAEVLFLLTV